MAKTPAARLLLLTTLLQLLFCCSTTEPLRIHLGLDGKTDPRFKNIKTFSIDVKDLSDSELAVVQKQITDKKEKHIRLYISGDFEVTREKVDDPAMKYYTDVFLNKKGKDVAEIVSKMIPPTAIGLVVFPTITTELFSGCKFLEEFEKYIHNTHKDLSVGRETIHLYLTLGDSFEQDAEEIGKTFIKQKEDDWLISVVINKELKFKKFIKTGDNVALSGQPWSDVTQSVYQVLIHEADTVMVPIVAKCAAAPTFKVGGFTAQDLSKQLLKVLKGNKRHPYQTVMTQLPNDCGTDEQRKTFTEELIKNMRDSDLDAYGKEPSAVLYVCQDSKFCGDAKKRMSSTHHNIQYYLFNKDVKDKKDSIIGKNTQVLDVKELSVEFHCHGSFLDKSRYVCGQPVDKLAETLKDFLNHFQFTSSPPIQIVFYACNVGTIKGRAYIHMFWDNLQNHIKNIKEIIAFTSWTSQVDSTPLVSIAEEDIFKTSKVIDGNEVHPDAKSLDSGVAPSGKVVTKPVNYAFGRFTVKVRKNEKIYNDIRVLPKTELELEPK